MTTVRRFVESDIPEVIGLHRRLFKPDEGEAPMPYAEYFLTTFLGGAGAQEEVRSLVAADTQGRIIGFIGAVIRPMRFHETRLRAAVSSQFMVDPQHRGSLAGVQLLQRFLSGAQDLSFTDEANEPSARLWERLGGVRSPIQSVHWLVPLRPARLAMSWLRSHSPLCATAMRPAVGITDKCFDYFLSSHSRQTPARLRQLPLHSEALLRGLHEIQTDGVLSTDYSLDQLDALLANTRSRKKYGALHPILLHASDGRLAGWYLYHLNSGSLCEVLQIAPAPGFAEDVFAHLFRHAFDRGAAGLVGRYDAGIHDALAKHHSLIHPRRDQMLIHSRDPSLVRAVTAGSALLSRLDGEWCLRFS